MKERPIILTTQEVQAVLAERKTMFRRVMKPQPTWAHVRPRQTEGGWVFGVIADDVERFDWRCPYGKPGDRLWVRESWRLYDSSRECVCYDDCVCAKHHGKVIYRADSQAEKCWRPSIHMPRWASRILLEVEEVRIERLQDVSKEDAIAEGFEKIPALPIDPRDWFRNLWDSLNTKPSPERVTVKGGDKGIARYVSYPFEFTYQVDVYKGCPHIIRGNPWVWVVKFKVIDRL